MLELTFFLSSIGAIVLPQVRKSESPVIEWIVLFLLENSGDPVVGDRKNFFFFN